MKKRKLIDCSCLLEALRCLTADGTSIWLFDVPPYEVEQEEITEVLSWNETGIIPAYQRKLSGTVGKRAKLIEKDKGFGTYKKWNPDHTEYDIKAITKEQHILKEITLAALTTKNIFRFSRKAKHLLNKITDYKFNTEFLSQGTAQEVLESWEDLLDEIRHQCHMTLLSAITQPELKEKAKLYWDILKQSDNEAFDRTVKVKQELSGKVETTNTQIDLPAIIPPDGWNVNI